MHANTPALTHPIAALADDPADLAPHAVFTRERQVAFLHALAGSGAVRPSAAQAGISYRTAYRERRASPAFRRAWDAALLSARALHEDVLASRAIDGVEEEVWYHGEVVATRRRYDARLLLAHLARLDRLTEDARLRAFADDYEGALERFAAGIDDPAPVCAECGEALAPLPGERVDAPADNSSPGLCDRCDKPPAAARRKKAAAPAIENPCPDCGGRCLDETAELTKRDCQWFGNRLLRFEDARPIGARWPHQFPGYDPDEVEAEQMWAFEEGVERWWLVVPGPDGDDGKWHYADGG
ncbi:hypothetical protein [Tsuneonella sp. SYSU-LHT278]|uniref:hypothetical protein n=1 Tax=Tsuneonella sediminis TaxID=3416089 RepID=UPI003F79411A